MIIRSLTSLSTCCNVLKYNKRILTTSYPYRTNFYNNFRNASYNINTNVAKDVILFHYENPRLYKMMNIFAICQFGFWSYLSLSAFSTLKNVPVRETNENDEWWRKVNLGEKKYRYTLTFLSFFLGKLVTKLRSLITKFRLYFCRLWYTCRFLDVYVKIGTLFGVKKRWRSGDICHVWTVWKKSNDDY